MVRFLEGPFDRISYKLAFDVAWPEWTIGEYITQLDVVRSEERKITQVENKRIVNPIFDGRIGEVFRITESDKKSVRLIEYHGTVIGELWLRRFVNRIRDLFVVSHLAEVYTRGEIHTDPLTTYIETGIKRYRIEQTATRRFDTFVVLQRDRSIALARGDYRITMTKMDES